MIKNEWLLLFKGQIALTVITVNLFFIKYTLYNGNPKFLMRKENAKGWKKAQRSKQMT